MSIHIFSNIDGEDAHIREVWSDAARAASIAARGHRGKGFAQRSAIAKAVYTAAGGKRNPKRLEKIAARDQERFENTRKAFMKQQQIATKNFQQKRAGEIASALKNDTKKRTPVEKVRITGYGDTRDVKFVRRSATTGKGKSKTYHKVTPSSRARLARALGSGAKGYYFTNRTASRYARGGWDAHRGETKTGMISYNARRRRR